MSRNNRATVKTHRRQQRSKHQVEEGYGLDLFAAYRLLCGCWSSQPAHTCDMAPPRYCTCGASTNEGCACPSPIGRAA